MINMRQRFYFIILLAQVFSIHGNITNVQVTSLETSISLQWTVTDTNATYEVVYGVSSNASDRRTDPVTMPTDGGQEVVHTLTGLDSGQLYSVEIQENGASVYQKDIGTKPLPVSNIQQTGASVSAIELTWSSSSAQYSYQVTVTGVTNTSFSLTSATLTSTSYVLPGLQHSSNYSVTIVTISNGVESNQSEEVYVNTAPLSPTNLTVVAIDTRLLNISWLPEETSAQDSYIISYTYNVTTEGAAINERTENVTCEQVFCQVEMPGIPGQMYDISVYSKLGSAVSQPAMTVHSTKPPAVSSLEETFGNDTSIHLQWTITEPANFHRFILHVMSALGTLTIQANSNDRDTVITDLNVGSIYNVTIYVSSGYEISEPFEKMFYTYPLQIDNLTIDTSQAATVSTLPITWTINDSATYDSFIINIFPLPEGSSFPKTLPKDTFNYTFTGLSPGLGYLVSIVTKLSLKESDPVNNTFYALPNAPAQENMTLTVVSSSEVSVQWEAPSGQVDGYRLTLTSAGMSEPKIVTLTGTQHTFLSLQSGTGYTVKLESQSGGVFSEPISKTVTTNPMSPSNLTVTFTDSSEVKVTWEEPSNTSFDHYLLIIEPADTVSNVEINRTGPLEHSFQGLNPGVLYTVSLSTFTDDGTQSETVSIRAITNPLPVYNLKIVPDGTGLRVSWNVNDSTTQSSFMVSYEEQVSKVVRELAPIPSVADQLEYSVVVPDLYPGGTYTVRVRAWQNVSGESAGSTEEAANGTTKPKPVENLTATQVEADVIELDWSPPEDSVRTHFFIKHRPDLRNPDAPWVENSTLNSNLTLRDLFPGERYVMEVYTNSNDVLSDVRMVQVVLAPLPPKSVDVLVAKTTSDSVTIQWQYDMSRTYVENWVISYENSHGAVTEQLVPSNMSGAVIEAKVTDLVAGYQYNFAVQADVQGTRSDKVSTQATTKPANNVELSFISRPTNTSFIINYSIQETDIFDDVKFILRDPPKTVTKNKKDPDRFVEFTDLNAGALYTVEVQTVSGGLESDLTTIAAQTLPNAPLVAVKRSPREITLTITKPSGGVNKYWVTCVNQQDVIIKDAEYDLLSEPLEVKVTGLVPYTTYTCSVAAIFQSFNSTTVKSVVTSEAAPSKVRDLRVIETAPNEVKLMWKEPEVTNGQINIYTIKYEVILETGPVNNQLDVPYTKKEEVIRNLKAGYNYTFTIWAVTVEAGEPTSVAIMLRTYKPVYKDGISALQATPRIANPKLFAPGTSSVTFNFTNAFSDKYGDIIQYTVIVTEDKDATDIKNKHILPGWKVAQNDPAIKAYQVVQNCSTFFDTGSTCGGKFGVRSKRAVGKEDYKVFEIGSETSCTEEYCNGPLKADTTYYIILRAYTTMQYADTEISEPVRTAAIPVPDEGPNVGAIVGSVIAVLVGVGVVFVAIFVMRRRMQQKSNMYRHEPGEQLTARSSISQRKPCPVFLVDFKEHIRSMRADSDFKYAEQFEDLKEVGRGQPQTAAELASNRGKNRFTNILPYDHSRVKLLPIDDEEGSDYINANYIPGYSSKREYIVTQGPLPATRDDFWRMLWEQNVRNIVMLTKCIENGREKCDRYWPNGSDAVFYGDLQVATLNETLFPDWTITEFKVSLGDQTRQIRHFHFTSWPDFGVPKKEQVLVRFTRMVREKLMKDGGPIIIHCSAGVGRSGTFIVLDRMLQHIKTHDSVDIFSTVTELRKDRVWMVQTEQQYICIHNCLLCVLEGREDEHIYANVGHSNVAFEDDEGVDLN